jgi:ATP-dependent Clp endopeptidase proteolytic subunit ClpP
MPARKEDKETTIEERNKFTAEAEAAHEEAQLHRAEARKVTAEAKQAEILLAAKKRAELDELAKNQHNSVYVFDRPVDEDSVKACINQLVLWTRQKDNCEIELQINSPGGAVIDGFALVDFIFDLRAKGHTINTRALGAAASMAGVLLQTGNKRIMGENAFLLIHEAQFGAVGSFGKIEDQVKFVEIMHERILNLFASRAELINKKTTKGFIKRSWSRKDWWMTADTALGYGFIDEVR